MASSLFLFLPFHPLRCSTCVFVAFPSQVVTTGTATAKIVPTKLHWYESEALQKKKAHHQHPPDGLSTSSPISSNILPTWFCPFYEPWPSPARGPAHLPLHTKNWRTAWPTLLIWLRWLRVAPGSVCNKDKFDIINYHFHPHSFCC